MINCIHISIKSSQNSSVDLHVLIITSLLDTIPRCCKDVSVNSFFPRTTRLWNSLPIECFPLTYDLNGFKSRINKNLLTFRFFLNRLYEGFRIYLYFFFLQLHASQWLFIFAWSESKLKIKNFMRTVFYKNALYFIHSYLGKKKQ